MTSDLLKKIPPQHYLHVLNNNTNVVRVEVGPKTLLLLDEEVAVYGPTAMVIIPPRHYCIVENPVCYTVNEGNNARVIEYDAYGQAKLRHGATEVRLEQDPFPLYPGEQIKGKIEPLEIVPNNEALKLEATHDFHDRYSFDENGEKKFRRAGEKWLFYGPATYTPQPEIRVVHSLKAEVLKPNQAIKLEAINNFTDRNGIDRFAGEQWLYSAEGGFIPDINEKIVDRIVGIILTDKKAIHVEALSNFKDSLGFERKAGDVWLVTKDFTEVYIPDVQSRIFNPNVQITSLTNRQYCIIANPVDENNKPQYGKRVLVRGESNFFLRPYEIIEQINEVEVLIAEKALVVKAVQSFEDDESGRVVRRTPGEKWLVKGPKEYWPPLEVVIENRIEAFFKIEGSLYLFKFDAFVLSILSVLVGLFLFYRFVRTFI